MSLVGGTHDSKSSAIEKALVAGGISSITVGIIGGGVIGGVVAHALLDAGIPPPAVLMSTRSPLRQKDLVGAKPIAKIRSLFHSPHALSAGADDTLPLLIEAQRALRQDAIDGDEPIEQYGLSAGRLPDEQVLELSAAGFASDAQAVARAVNALRTVCGDLELPPALAQSVAIEALFGPQPQGVVNAIHREVEEANAEAAAAAMGGKAAAAQPKPSQPGANGQDDDDDEFDDLRERFGVVRLQAAFVNRIRGEEGHGSE